MRVGIVGCGYWGSKHVRVLNALPEVSSVVAIDPDTTRTAQLRAQYPGTITRASLEDAIDVVDAVVIATAPAHHASMAATAIEAGKHVMIEKPMTRTSAEARHLIERAEVRGVTLMAGHTFEYNAAVLHLRELVRSGALGDVHYLDAARLNLGLYRDDVNVLWDLAAHDISIANMVLDAVPISVSAWGFRHAGHVQEDVASMRMDYGSGQVATIRVSWLDPCKVRRVTVVGFDKMAVYNDLLDDDRIRIFDKGVAPDEGPSPHVPMSYRQGAIVSPYVAFDEPLMTEDRTFVHCARTGATPPSDGYSGLAVVQALEAADESIRRGGQAVPLSITIPDRVTV